MNQLAASIKLLEVWKMINIKDYPLQLEKNHVNHAETGREVRPSTNRMWNEDSRTRAAKEGSSRDAAKLWNMAPITIKNELTMSGAKTLIKSYCKTLPI